MSKVAPAPESRLSWRPLVVLSLSAVFGAFGVILWLSHPGGAPLGTPPLIRATLTPVKMAPKRDEFLSDSPMPVSSEGLLLPLPERSLIPVATSNQPDAASPGLNGTSAASNGPRINVAALLASKHDDLTDLEQAVLAALVAEAERFDLLPKLIVEADPPRASDSTDVLASRSTAAEHEGALPRPELVVATRDVPEASASPAPPTDTSVPTTTTAPAVAGAARVLVSGRVFWVQLGAVRAKVDARRAWQQLQSDHAGILSELGRHFERAETNNGIFYRVQAGPFATASVAASLCDELRQRKASCFVVRR